MDKAVRTGPLAALIISAIWMVHPVHSAAIDYISGRADSLAFLFAAAAWLLVLRPHANSSWSKFTLCSGGIFGTFGACSRGNRLHLAIHFPAAHPPGSKA